MSENSEFEQLAVNLLKRFSPQKKDLTITSTNLRELKDVVKSTILSTPKSFQNYAAAQSTSFMCMEEEDSRLSGCDTSEDSHSISQFSNEEESSRLSAANGARRLSKSSSGTSLMGKPPKHTTRVKRLQEVRSARRKIGETTEFKRFDCSENDFGQEFSSWFLEEALKEYTEPVKLFNVVMNTINEFFCKKTWDRIVENLVTIFLNDFIVKSLKEINDSYDSIKEQVPPVVSEEQRVLEIQTTILLELKHIEMSALPATDMSEIVRKLRFLYVVKGAIFMRDFMEKDVADHFAITIPKVIAEIFEELCVTVPIDIDEQDPNSASAVPQEFVFPWFQPKVSSDAAKKLELLLEETALSESGSTGKENTKEKARKERSLNGHAAKSLRAAVEASPIRREKRIGSSRLPRTVPETPEEKLLKREEEEQRATTSTEVVKQTPMSKLRCTRDKKISKKLSGLIKVVEENATRPSRAAALASKEASKAIIQESAIPPTTKRQLFALNTPSPRPQRSARTSLIDRFSSVATEPSSSKESPRKASVKVEKPTVSKPVPPTLDRKRKSSSIVDSEQSINGIHGFGKEQVSRYKQRMTSIMKMKDSEVVVTDTSEDGHRRVGLYDDQDQADKPAVNQKEVQKNRTGREVRSGTTVHLAHILLNVHNPAPLDAFYAHKLSAGCSQKLQKLVKIAKKKDVRRLNKLRNRVRFCQQSDSPSNSQTATEVVDLT